MKKPLFSKASLVLYVIVMASGCAPVEKWDLFSPDPGQQSTSIMPDLPENADRFRPQFKESIIELPPAGQPPALSVEQFTMLALQRNRDLQVRQLNPVIAGTFEKIEGGFYDPELFAEFQYFNQKSTEISRATGELFPLEATDSDATIGLQQALPTGTTVAGSIAHEGNRSNRAPEQQTARVGLTVTQALLQGFGPAVNLVGIRQARLDTVAGIFELRGYTEALVAETEIAYWNYVLSVKEISIYESSLDIARQQLHQIEQQIEVGLLPETQAAAARAEAALREQSLIDARSLLENRRLALLRLISRVEGDEPDVSFTAVSEPWIEPESIQDQAERISLAEKMRPDLEEARMRLKQGRLETVRTRNGLLPKLDFFIDLGLTGFADRFSESFKRLDADTYDFSAGVRFRHFLRNRAAEARHEAATVSHFQAAKAVENLVESVRLDVRLAVNEVERSRRQIRASAATRRLEEETLHAEKERFGVGSSTALLVAQAQRDLLVSQIAEVRAVIQYRIALVQLYLAEGTLLERRGVFVGDPSTTSY